MSQALALVEDLHIQHFVVASDCKQVISDIDRSAKGAYGAIISEINVHATSLNCIFSFKSRAVNYEAHSLAKFAFSRAPGRHVWFGTPHDLRCTPLHVDFDE